MNAIDELVREFAPPADEDGSAVAAAEYARRELRRAMRTERPRPHPRRRQRRWRLGLPVAVAAGLAAAILGLLALLPAHDEHAPAPASAATVLELAARTATERPAAAYPGPHQYLYLKFIESWTLVESYPAGGSSTSFAFRTADTQQDWVAPNGSGRQRMIVAGPPRFLTPADRAAWTLAGRPGVVPPSSDGTYPAGGYPAGNQLNPSSLPIGAGALLRAVVARFEGGKFNLERTFETVGTLLQDSSSPALRAALYRMVARLPGVQLLGRRSDPLGRTGIAVGVMVAGVRNELLFDPTTSDVLEEAQVQVAHTLPALPGFTRTLPSGTVLHDFVYLGRGVVNSVQALPGGGRVPLPGSKRLVP